MAINALQLENACSFLRATGKIPVLLTGGPTCEDIDPVRFITNRSTGRMGTALAEAAVKLDMSPVLIHGQGITNAPDEITCVEVRSAQDMLEAVLALFPLCQIMVMSAAVADYTPAEPLNSKLKKADGELFLRLKRTQDILRELSLHPQRTGKRIAGFSLDTEINAHEGRRKLKDKNLDLIAVNATSAFAGEKSSILLLGRDGLQESLPEQPKITTALYILSLLRRML